MTSSILIRTFQYLFIILLPFLVFYWMLPILGELSIGNDYVMFSIDHQLILQYSLEHGSFPLFAPGFAGVGHSAAALTLGQMYHPVSHLASLMPGYWDGSPLEGNTFFKLFGIGLTHLAVFVLLIRLKLKDALAFALSFVVVYNLRMLDMFRYGAALENYLGSILLSSAMALHYLKPTRIASVTLIIGATYLMITGGHPQIMYFGLLGAGLVCLLIPFTLSAITGTAYPSIREAGRFYATMGICVAVGTLLAAVYIIPFYWEFIRENSSRVARRYSWSLGYSDSWGGVLNSFFRPLYSNVHGAFGSSSIILFAAIAPLLVIFQKKVPKVVLILFGVSLLVFLISLGGATPVHRLFWTCFPLADTFRTPGRINQILPVLFMFLLVWQIKQADAAIGRFSLPFRLSPAFLLSLVAILIYVVYNVFIIQLVPEPTHYHPAKINEHSHQITLIAYWSGLAALIILSFYFLFRRFQTVIGLLLCAAVLLQTGVELRWGTWIVNRRSKPTLEQIDKRMQRHLKVVGLAGFGMEPLSVSEQMKHAILDPHLAAFYRNYHTVKDNGAAYDYMAKYRKSTEGVIVAPNIAAKSATCPNSVPTCGEDKIVLKESRYNSVRFELDATEAGLFTISFPYMPRFEADVDGETVPVYRTNGYQVGLLAPAGKHAITVRYTSPATCLGLLLSLATLFGLTLVLGFRVRHRYLRLLPPIAGAIAAASLFFAWNSSLYSGDNLGTRYTWRSDAFSPEDNIAYGRRTEMTGVKSHERPYDDYAGKGVDGIRKRGGFSSHKTRANQWWQVDLGAVRPIDRVVIYDRYSLSKHLPLLVQVSDNGKRFDTAVTLKKLTGPRQVEVDLAGRKTRYIRLKSSGKGGLSLKEIEVYGATPF